MAEYNPSKIIKDGNTYNFRDNTKIPLAGSNQISGDLIPSVNAQINLGSSTNMWKSINDVNPGALSLQGTPLINVASSITALDGSASNTFTPQVNGWLLINGTGAANDGFIYVKQGRIGMVSATNSVTLRCATLIPVVAGVEVTVNCKLGSLTWANIAPCQGNV